MHTITEPSREIPVVAEADVVVCGGGPGGFSAAIAAARRGAKTVLIERYGFLGGLATAALISPFLGHLAADDHVPLVAGILREMTEGMHAIGGALSWEKAVQAWGINFDAEALKVVLDRMCQDSAVQVMLHTFVTDVAMDNGRIAAVITESKSGRRAIAGKIFVDATGDADVAYRAGAPTEHGRAFDGKGGCMGSFFHLGGVDPVDPMRFKVRDIIRREMDAGRFSFYKTEPMAWNSFHTDHTSANMTITPGDADNADDLTKAEMNIRRDIWELVMYLRESIPGFENCYVQQTSAQVGGRESRRIVGPYRITAEDAQNSARFDDAIVRCGWWLDLHCPLGKPYPVHYCVQECPEGANCAYWASEHERMIPLSKMRMAPGKWFEIPYRCLSSVGVPNLLSSGRCISSTHEGLSATRCMGTCVGLGQAAGTAAALALQQGVSAVADVNVQKLQDMLREDGQII